MTQKLVIAKSSTVVDNIATFETTTGQIKDSGIPITDYPTEASQAEMEAGTASDVFVSASNYQLHESACKAWVSFSEPTSIVINGSYNIASITDNGLGDATVIFDTNFSDANYCAVVRGNINRAAGSQPTAVGLYFTSPQASSSVRTLSRFVLGGAEENAEIEVACYGDQ